MVSHRLGLPWIHSRYFMSSSFIISVFICDLSDLFETQTGGLCLSGLLVPHSLQQRTRLTLI